MRNAGFDGRQLPGKKGLTLAIGYGLAMGLGTIGLLALPVQAKAQTTQTETAARDFDIKEGNLGPALLRFGEQSGLQFSIGSGLTQGKRTAGISGKYTPEDGLRALLAGTGLMFRFTGPRTVVIEPAPDTGDARVLGPLRIEGADRGTAGVSGINGSTDATATEGTGSYTTGATSVITKLPTSIKDTPRTVSVVSSQQIEDQNIITFNQVMAQTPGISMSNTTANRYTFMSRGFEVTRFRIDGGAAMRTSNHTSELSDPIQDMAIFDHVEIVRGADGMFSGYGDPGGVVSLQRKRPLDHAQVNVDLQAGSWNLKRTVVDATSPMGFNGALRGRTVIGYEDRDYFYDYASTSKSFFYGVLEADLASNLVARVGLSQTNTSGNPGGWGLPRYQTGEDLHLPRSTCMCMPWDSGSDQVEELFLQTDWKISDNWLLNANLTRISQDALTEMSDIKGAINPVTGGGLRFGYTDKRDYADKRESAEVMATGAFRFLGRDHKVVLGATHSLFGHHRDLRRTVTWARAGERGWRTPDDPPRDYFLDPFAIDPYDIINSPYLNTHEDFVTREETESSIYANFDFQLLDKLYMSFGVRRSWTSYEEVGQSWCAELPGCENAWWDPELQQVMYGEPYTFGEIRTRNVPAIRPKDNNTSWPPTVALRYLLNDKVTLYGSYADIYQSQAGNVDRNLQPLDPVTGTSAEFGIKYASLDGRLNASSAVYYTEKKGYAIDDGRGDGYQVSPGVNCCYLTTMNGVTNQQNSYGLDLEVQGVIVPGVQVSASYNYNHNEWELAGDWGEDEVVYLSYSPKHLFKFWSNVRFKEFDSLPAWTRPLELGLGVNAQSKTFNTGWLCTVMGPEYVDPTTGGRRSDCQDGLVYEFTGGFRAIVAAMASYEINSRWNATLNINNLFDKTYYQTMGNPDGLNFYGEPRSFSLALRGRF